VNRKLGRGYGNKVHLKIDHSVNDNVYAAIKCLRFPMSGMKWQSTTIISDVTCGKCLAKLAIEKFMNLREYKERMETEDMHDGPEN
jgi:hypothetical protein